MNLEQALLEVEQAWVRAHLEMDLDTIEYILDEDYTQLKSDGSLLRKQDLLADYATGQRVWEIAHSEPLKVQIMGEVALLYGMWRGKGTNHGQPFDYSAPFLAVYRLRDGEWKLAADASLG